MLAVGPLGPQYSWLFAWHELGISGLEVKFKEESELYTNSLSGPLLKISKDLVTTKNLKPSMQLTLHLCQTKLDCPELKAEEQSYFLGSWRSEFPLLVPT